MSNRELCQIVSCRPPTELTRLVDPPRRPNSGTCRSGRPAAAAVEVGGGGSTDASAGRAESSCLARRAEGGTQVVSQPGAGLGVVATCHINRHEMLGIVTGEVHDLSRKQSRTTSARYVARKQSRTTSARYVADAVPSGALRIVMSVDNNSGDVGRVNEPKPDERANCVIKRFSLEELYKDSDDEVDRKHMLTLWSAVDIPEGQFLSVYYGTAYEPIRKQCKYKAGLPALGDVPVKRVLAGLSEYCRAHGVQLTELVSKFGVLDPQREDEDNDAKPDRSYSFRGQPCAELSAKGARRHTRAAVAAGCCDESPSADLSHRPPVAPQPIHTLRLHSG